MSFHSFPKEPGLLKKWIDATGRQNWHPSKNTKICSKHFDTNYYICKGKVPHLKPNAIPTIDVGVVSAQSSLAPKNLQSMPSTSSKGVKRKRLSNDENVSPLPVSKIPKLVENPTVKDKNASTTLQDVSNIPIPQTSLMEKIIKTDVGVKDPLKLLEKQKQVSAMRLQKLRAVRESRRRLKKKAAKLENILVELKSKMFINTEEAEVLLSIQNGNKEFLKRFLVESNSRKK